MNVSLIDGKTARTYADTEILGMSIAMDSGPCKNDYARRKIAAVLRDYVELRREKKVKVKTPIEPNEPMTINERTALLDLLSFVANQTWTRQIPKDYVTFAGEVRNKVQHDLDHYRMLHKTFNGKVSCVTEE